MNNAGTPRTLDRAISNGIAAGPMSKLPDSMYWAIRDFLAQKFGVAYLMVSADELKVLHLLFENITKREENAENKAPIL